MKEKAFSLVEFSAVLVIISLLIAGVTKGIKLVAQAKLQRFIIELEEMKAAVHTFKIAYNTVPGDFAKAAAYWSGQTNGNGNGKIDSGERLHAWTQLNASKTYISNITTEAGSTIVFPEINKRFIFVEPGGGFHGESINRNTLQIGAGAGTDNPGFLPADSYFIDRKLDDSLPKSGIITFRIQSSTTDASCTNTSSSYYLTSSAIGCNMVYVFETE